MIEKLATLSLQAVSPALLQYIDTEIFPLYQLNESGHGLPHIKYVIRRSFQFAQTVTDLNPDIIYTISAYHDLGHHIDPESHESISAQIASEDASLRQFFTDSEIASIVAAIEDHRSNNPTMPRNIYGKILRMADRTIDVDKMCERTYLYRCRNDPQADLLEIIEASRQHLIEKYGRNGYALQESYFPDPEMDAAIRELHVLLDDPAAFTQRYCAVNHLTPPASPQ